MIETFKERFERELSYIIAIKQADYIIKELDSYIKEENRKNLRLLGDILSMEFLPKKPVLNSKTKEVNITFLSKKLPKKIEYKADVIYDLLKKLGINLPFFIVKKYCFAKDVQKKRPNKYYYIDIRR